MKKLLAIATVFALALCLAACASQTLAVEGDEMGVHVVAENNVSGSGISSITIGEGEGLCINHIIDRGSFHVVATSSTGEVVFDADIANNIADLVDCAPGDYTIDVTANSATGSLDIIPYDKAAQAQADATMPDEVRQALSDSAASN